MSTRPLYADDLINLAYHLAGRGAGRGKPRVIWLRRAVSTAYYALFHELTTQAAGVLVGPTASDSKRQRATRWISHTDLRLLTDGVAGRGGGSRAVVAVLDSVSPDVETISANFGTLQDARHRADYDHEYEIARSQTLQLVDIADQSVDLIRQLIRVKDESFQVFLRLMVGAVKVAKNR